MRYKHFKNANVDVSEISIGCWAMGKFGYGNVEDENSIKAIRAMLEGGVNLIDTAPVYGAGHSEMVVGKAIQGLDRSKFYISSKVGVGVTTLKSVRETGGTQVLRDSTYASVLYECEQSLRRLGTDYIDFYFVHWPDYDTPFKETMEALNTLKAQGKIRHICLSNFSIEQMEECMKYAQIDAIQPPYSMVVRKDVELMKWCQEKGIDTLTYGSLGAGILTGAFRSVPKFNDADPRNDFYPFFKEPQFSKVMKLLEVMDELSARINKPLSQIALNWACQKDYVSSAIVGVTNVKHVDENLSTFDWKLSDDDVKLLDDAVEKYLDFDGGAPLK